MAAVPSTTLETRPDEAASGAAAQLQGARDAMAREDFAAAETAAEAATTADPAHGQAWYVLGLVREKLGAPMAALEAYERALALMPDQADLAKDLGRLAMRLGLPELAAPLFELYLAQHPESREALVSLAAALRDRHSYDAAIDLLRPAIRADPTDARLWDALGVVLAQRGEPATAATFFGEALRLDPDFAQARYHLSGARLDLGEVETALAEVETALQNPASPGDAAMMGFSRALTLLSAGRIGEGWDAYAARLSPDLAAAPEFRIAGPRWAPGQPLTGKTLLVVAEQGVGDEVLFASLIPEVLAALGPKGRLYLAVEPRLVDLFRQSFPSAIVGAHATDKRSGRAVRTAPFLDAPSAGISSGSAAPDARGAAYDLWAPMGALLAGFRRDLNAFPSRTAYLTPDPARVAHWRAWLSGLPEGRKVGVLWKSLKLGAERRRGFAPFDAWAPVFQTRGLVFVNLQYGDCSAEFAEAEARFGATLHTPPALDLKADLDGVAALCAALDLTLGFATATPRLAGAVGAPVWLIVGPDAWLCLGTDHYPWYPQARVFKARSLGDWAPVMAEVAAALGSPQQQLPDQSI